MASSTVYFDDARIVLEDGTELTRWTEYSINSDFTTPTDGWSFSFGGDTVWDRVKNKLRVDTKAQIFIGDSLQCTGYVDRVSVSASHDGGTKVSVSGRDILRVLVKANIYPDWRVKDRTVAELVESVLRMYYNPPPVLQFDNSANRLIITGADKRLAASSASGKRHVKKTTSEVEYCSAHVNEGAFEFLSRNVKRFGLWIWATADGSVVIGGPDYEQVPSYTIRRRKTDFAVSVPRAEYTVDRTSVPSQYQVKGKSTSKEFDKATVMAVVPDPDRRTDDAFWEPLYVNHDQAETQEQAEAFARQEMTRLKENERVYSCTCLGHRDMRTGNLYAIDTTATVEDQVLGVQETMYVKSRTFRKSIDGGTLTDLVLVPLHAIQFSAVDAPGGS